MASVDDLQKTLDEAKKQAEKARQEADKSKAALVAVKAKLNADQKAAEAERKAADDERDRAKAATFTLNSLVNGGIGSGGADVDTVTVPPSDLPPQLTDGNQLTCCKCKDFFLEPRVLPCYHSFCEKCVCMVGSTAVCRICSNGTRQSTAKPNTILKKFIDKCGLTPKPKGCSYCTTPSEAVLYCYECPAKKRLMCSKHADFHANNDFTSDHRTGLPGEAISAAAPIVAGTCSQHSKIFEKFCEPCNVSICSACIEKHPGHKLLTFEEAAAKARPIIENRFTGVLLAISDKISKEIVALETRLDEKLTFNPTTPSVVEITKQIMEKKQRRFTVRLYIDSTIRTIRTMTDIEIIEPVKAERWFNIIRDVTPDEFEGRVGVVKKFDKLVSFMTPPPARAGNYLGGVFGDGVVLVTSTNYHQVFFYDLVGNKLPTEFGKLSQANSADGFLYYPRALAVDRNGLFLVGDDYGTGRFQVFDKTGVLRKKIIANGNFGNICSIAIDYNTGNIFLGDNSNKKVVVYDADGNFVRKFGTAGSGDKEFNYLAGLAISQNGDVIVSDSYALKVFTQDGIFKAKIGNSGKATGEFDGSMGVVVDGAGNVIVADSGNKRLQVFDSNYKFVQQVITPSQKPSALSIDGEGRLLVVEYDTQYFYILG